MSKVLFRTTGNSHDQRRRTPRPNREDRGEGMDAETAKIHLCEWMIVTAALGRSRAGEQRPE